MNEEFPGALPDQRVILTKHSLIEEANCVLIFAFYNSKLVLVRHRSRGWELPGGTRLEGESILRTVAREMYEEAGGELDSVERIGQYVIYERSELAFVKNIYISKVSALKELPRGFETDAVMLLDAIPKQADIINDPAYSPLMKDKVYLIVSEWIKAHPFSKC
ncbi:MAG: hypothetical protein K0Q59_3698 [Paenibacillus sp.]|nr:hypothetical protein [Paenibacillus sp.]